MEYYLEISFRSCAGTFKYLVGNWNMATLSTKKIFFWKLVTFRKRIWIIRMHYLDLKLHLKNELQQVLKQEEIMWLRRRKWIGLSFRAKATVRKKGKENFKIKNDHGLWWFTGGGLEQVFVQDFKRRFFYDSPLSLANLRTMTWVIHHCVTDVNNLKLDAAILDDEVCDAVKSIGAPNAYGPTVTVLVSFRNAGILSKGQWAL